MTRLRFVVRGRVQGVGFRWFVVQNAQELGLTGWVRNRKDGAVEGEAQGEKVQELAAALKEGPSLSRVEAVEAEPVPLIKGEEGFEVR